MTKHAKVVIGANFGDEGKGLITDFLASQTGAETLVVRHNGGAQAGHTVTTPDGKRHVFRHFGSGTLAGAQTFLSRFYVCNPILFFKELALLESLNITPKVYVAADSPITTPYDMMINQIIEEFRGDGRHGSCGVGCGETVDRTENTDYAVYFGDLENTDLLRKKLKSIQTAWTPKRLKALGVESLSEEWVQRLNSEDIFERYLEEVENFLNRANRAPASILEQTEYIVFEGAQGLLLDQERGFFPHVTRSHTGIRNAVTLAQEAGIAGLEITYITRAYNTRHGAGPLPHELPKKPYESVVDETNIFNEYQGDLRFGWLDIDQLTKAIQTDFSDAPDSLKVNYQLAVTCVDQIEGKHSFVSGGTQQSTGADEFLSRVKETVKAQSLIISRGPTRETISPHL